MSEFWQGFLVATVFFLACDVLAVVVAAALFWKRG